MACQFCNSTKNTVPGNDNILNGVAICDACVSLIFKMNENKLNQITKDKLDSSLTMVKMPKNYIKTLEDILKFSWKHVCLHDGSTHVGGVLWTICDDCGAKWEGRNKAKIPEEIEQMEQLLSVIKGI